MCSERLFFLQLLGVGALCAVGPDVSLGLYQWTMQLQPKHKLQTFEEPASRFKFIS